MSLAPVVCHTPRGSELALHLEITENMMITAGLTTTHLLGMLPGARGADIPLPLPLGTTITVVVAEVEAIEVGVEVNPVEVLLGAPLPRGTSPVSILILVHSKKHGISFSALRPS